jgi:hypothetical protein
LVIFAIYEIIEMNQQPKRYLVTSALPYANGLKHIGHLAGAYIPADIYVRYLRAQKRDVVFVCGSDEHGTAIPIQAMKEGTTPQGIIDKYHVAMKEDFADLQISFDIYHRTSDPLHHETSREFFTYLHERGELETKETEQYYDAASDTFLADRYIKGTCPHCKSDRAFGDQCETCGTALSPDELINPVSTISGNKPEKKKTSHWYLPLAKHESFLREWILDQHKDDWRPSVLGQCKSWIDGGLHANEVVGAHQLIETAYQLASRQDDETKAILDNVIILMTHANPDGQELVSEWYMRNPVKEKRNADNLPRLYEKYAGHDNNRDFYMLNLKETQNMCRQLYIEWLPQIMYNHHQSGPPGSVVAGPPFRDPFNYAFDPIVITSLEAVGAAMINRLNVENKPGYTNKNGSVYSTWYNGGLRTTTYFHNMIGLLTEIIGSPNPSNIPLVPDRLVPNSSTPNPVFPDALRILSLLQPIKSTI